MFYIVYCINLLMLIRFFTIALKQTIIFEPRVLSKSSQMKFECLYLQQVVA